MPSTLTYLRDIDATVAHDIRYATFNNFTGRPLPGYDAAECVLTREAAAALRQVQADLAASNLALKVYDCYRPERAVRAMAQWSRDGKDSAATKRFFPNIDKRNLFALGYIARVSRHSTGTAIDLTMIAKDAVPAAAFDAAASYGPCIGPAATRAPDNSLDMGTGYDCLDPRSHTNIDGLSLEQHQRRMLLVTAMRKRGFSNYFREWWHFTFAGGGAAQHYDVPDPRSREPIKMDRIDRQRDFTGTKDVADALRFDVARLAEYLTANVNGFAGPLNAQQFKGGQSNPTYLLTTPTRRYVLRRKPPGKLLPSAHAVEREYRVIAALHRQGFPVAEPIILCNDPDVIGTAFYVMGHVEGRVIWEPDMPGATPAERAATYDAMNTTLAQLHSFDPNVIDLADFGRGENYVARQVERWSKQYRASETVRVEAMEHLIAWLPQHLPPQGPVRLVHGDFRLDNVILAANEPKVLAVLDWELSTLGDPLADFSYHLMQWHMPRSDSGADTGSLVGCDLAALGIPALETYVEDYVERTGLDPRPHLTFYLAYNFFRLAAIIQGIVGRVRDGTATSAHAAARADQVRPLAEKAWEFAGRT